MSMADEFARAEAEKQAREREEQEAQEAREREQALDQQLDQAASPAPYTNKDQEVAAMNRDALDQHQQAAMAGQIEQVAPEMSGQELETAAREMQEKQRQEQEREHDEPER